jgi:hypothetical protein
MTVTMTMFLFLVAMSVAAMSLEQVHSKVRDTTSRDTKTNEEKRNY